MKNISIFCIGVIFFIVACDNTTPSSSTDDDTSIYAGLTDDQVAFAKEKKLSSWPTLIGTAPDGMVVNLSDEDCKAVGGKIVYHDGCYGTRLKCVVNDRHVCIRKIANPDPPRE
jgi:hypothetical protein